MYPLLLVPAQHSPWLGSRSQAERAWNRASPLLFARRSSNCAPAPVARLINVFLLRTSICCAEIMLSNRRSPLGIDVLALKKDHHCLKLSLEKKCKNIEDGAKCLWNLFRRKFGTTHELESSVSVEIIQ